MNKGSSVLINGRASVGEGEIQIIGGDRKQFCATLSDAVAGDSATVEVLFTPDATKAKGTVIATLSVTYGQPVDFTAPIDMVFQNFYARVTAISGGSVHCFGAY